MKKELLKFSKIFKKNIQKKLKYISPIAAHKQNITITTRNSIKKKFIDIIFNFHMIDKDVFYKDLYFKDKLKDLILKNCKKHRNYKLSVYKYNQSVTGDITNYWIKKFNIDNISEIDNIDKLNLKNLKPIDFEDQVGFHREGYDGTNDLENIAILGGNIQSGG